jgi:F-type H+-transporting ATPase subunit delta
MSIARIASRFAVAILDAVPEGTDRERFFSDLDDVRRSIRASRELHQFFRSPVIPAKRKLETVDALFAERIGPFALNVLRFLVEREREEFVLEVLDTVFDLNREREGILATTVYSAVDLSDAQRTALQTALERASGKRVETEYALQPELMGGLSVRLGDTVYDGSVRRQLQRLHERFLVGT